jgi:putative NIF3 family GTP cyclohydrolase 1 type 2
VKEWGADLLIVHEPTYYSHMDRISNDPVSQAKLALVEESGLVIYRYHDHMHFRDIDLITEGELHHLGLEGTVQKTPYKASYILKLQVPVTARELARRMEKELHIAHVRMVGSLDASVTRIAACFGTPQGVFELMKHEDIELVLTGEACEWQLGEYARDAAALGLHKAMIVMGHIGSERDGMRLLAERLQERYDSFETKYFECGEVYEYLDSDR